MDYQVLQVAERIRGLRDISGISAAEMARHCDVTEEEYAAAEAGKVDRIIVSGDNRRREYNEPEAMRRALVERGIPGEVVILDYAGFRTFDSVVRAKEVFGQDSFIVVSQKFHNERAVFIAGLKDIDAVGFNAADIGLRAGGVLTHVREWGARCKVFLDMISGRQPHFLGDPIDIG